MPIHSSDSSDHCVMHVCRHCTQTKAPSRADCVQIRIDERVVTVDYPFIVYADLDAMGLVHLQAQYMLYLPAKTAALLGLVYT